MCCEWFANLGQNDVKSQGHDQGVAIHTGCQVLSSSRCVVYHFAELPYNYDYSFQSRFLHICFVIIIIVVIVLIV